jgi:hypothetical protein
MENKRYLQMCYLNDQEQHLALGVPTSEMAHAEGGREKAPAKQHQAKA